MGSEPTATISLAGFVFDPRYRELRDAATGRRVPMRPQTAAMLHCLASAAGHVVPKDDLLRAVWPNVVVTEDSLVQCVRDLRRVLGDGEHRIVQTEPKVGYRLMVQQEAVAAFKQDIRFAISADGVRVAYAISGEGPPLVRTSQWMTHVEWDWRSAVFGDFLSRLSERSRLVRYDARGCGLSDRGVPTATLDDEVRDLEAVVDAAGLDR
jgi:DNA-binding winged helix-turn-helix (wHTH) protein